MKAEELLVRTVTTTNLESDFEKLGKKFVTTKIHAKLVKNHKQKFNREVTGERERTRTRKRENRRGL